MSIPKNELSKKWEFPLKEKIVHLQKWEFPLKEKIVLLQKWEFHPIQMCMSCSQLSYLMYSLRWRSVEDAVDGADEWGPGLVSEDDDHWGGGQDDVIVDSLNKIMYLHHHHGHEDNVSRG